MIKQIEKIKTFGSDTLDILIDFKNYDSEQTIFKRTASRAIISDGEKYLMITSKYGDYKFPGGGQEEGENLVDTLIREVQEETGYHVIKNTVEKYGKVRERRKKRIDVMKMDSHYYFCKVEPEAGKKNLDEYEKEYEYQVVWVTLEEAIENNKQITDLDACPWNIREIRVMERLLKEQYFHKNVLQHLPVTMKTLLQGKNFEVDSIGKSASDVFIFENDLVLKAENKSHTSDGEYEMMQWLKGKLPVPNVVDFYSDSEKNYILMTRLKGKMACDPSVTQDVQVMAKLLAKGLQKLWEVNIGDCPRVIDLDYKLDLALYNIENNLVDMSNVEPETFGAEGFANPMELYAYLLANLPEEEKILIHGDYCLPNIFFMNGEISGYLDLGFCGIGDKWQDIALAVRSMKHNLVETGKGDDYPAAYRIFFEELGIAPDEEKMRYYILLDELF